MTPGGLPHSGIRGSTPADGYPRLIAAFHALHRLVAPRHPPCALNSSAPRNAPCRANRIELNHAHMLLLRCTAQPQFSWGGLRGSWPRVDPPWWLVGRPELKSRALFGIGSASGNKKPIRLKAGSATCRRPRRALTLLQAYPNTSSRPNRGSLASSVVRRQLSLAARSVYQAPLANANTGGRSWTRTRGLSLIRTAL
jgi:hypothetical protein